MPKARTQAKAKKPKITQKSSARMHAKAKAKKVASKPTAKAPKGFMWKLLENKEKQLQERAAKPAANPLKRREDNLSTRARFETFNKFSGSRRRAG